MMNGAPEWGWYYAASSRGVKITYLCRRTTWCFFHSRPHSWKSTAKGKEIFASEREAWKICTSRGLISIQNLLLCASGEKLGHVEPTTRAKRWRQTIRPNKSLNIHANFEHKDPSIGEDRGNQILIICKQAHDGCWSSIFNTGNGDLQLCISYWYFAAGGIFDTNNHEVVLQLINFGSSSMINISLLT